MKKPIILCVDDEKVILNSLKDQLKGNIDDYSIELAESGSEALEIIDDLLHDKAEIPVVISDYIMPGMKGDEFLQLAHERIPRAVKILLTGQATTEGISNAVNNANLYRFIAKPWQRDDLCMTIIEASRSYFKDKQLDKQNEELLIINKELIEMRDGIINTMVTALEARDSITAGHSKRMADYAVKFAKTVNSVTYGKYSEFTFTKEQIQELYFAALLHDIGKIGVSENILQKHYRITEEHQQTISYRFYYYKKCLQNKKMQKVITPRESELIISLDRYLDFILEISKRSYITDDEKRMLLDISDIEYTAPDNTQHKLLEEEELQNLLISKGNLTKEEREIIQSHVDYTYDILKEIPWSKSMELIPEIASRHHECMDGTGYSRGLKSDEILIQSRILAILDVFEALTAIDRPYKPPISVDNALKILEEETNHNHLDKDLFEIFMKEKVYCTK